MKRRRRCLGDGSWTGLSPGSPASRNLASAFDGHGMYLSMQQSYTPKISYSGRILSELYQANVRITYQLGVLNVTVISTRRSGSRKGGASFRMKRNPDVRDSQDPLRIMVKGSHKLSGQE